MRATNRSLVVGIVAALLGFAGYVASDVLSPVDRAMVHSPSGPVGGSDRTSDELPDQPDMTTADGTRSVEEPESNPQPDPVVENPEESDPPSAEAPGGSSGHGQAESDGVFHGLEWLAAQYPEEGDALWPSDPGDVLTAEAVSALAMLTYLGAGFTHTEGRYQELIKRTLRAVDRSERPAANEGAAVDVSAPYGMLSHAIVTMMWAESYGMTGSPMLKTRAEKATVFLLAQQMKTRAIDPDTGEETATLTGWGRTANSWQPDLLTTGYAVMALKSARVSGLDIPAVSLIAAANWADQVPGDTMLADCTTVVARSVSATSRRDLVPALKDRITRIIDVLLHRESYSLSPFDLHLGMLAVFQVATDEQCNEVYKSVADELFVRPDAGREPPDRWTTPSSNPHQAGRVATASLLQMVAEIIGRRNWRLTRVDGRTTLPD